MTSAFAHHDRRVVDQRRRALFGEPKRAPDLLFWWRGWDLNPRPSGYERIGQRSAVVGAGTRQIPLNPCRPRSPGHFASSSFRPVATRGSPVTRGLMTNVMTRGRPRPSPVKRTATTRGMHLRVHSSRASTCGSATPVSKLTERPGVRQRFKDEFAEELSHRHIELGRTDLECAVQVRGKVQREPLDLLAFKTGCRRHRRHLSRTSVSAYSHGSVLLCTSLEGMPQSPSCCRVVA